MAHNCIKSCSTSVMIKEYKLKPQDTTIHILDWLKLETLIITHDEDVQELECSHCAGGNVKCHCCLEYHFTCEVKKPAL